LLCVAERSHPTWKANAVKALQRIHAPAVAVTRDGLWTKLYARGLIPEKAADLAQRKYHGTHVPAWIKRVGRNSVSVLRRSKMMASSVQDRIVCAVPAVAEKDTLAVAGDDLLPAEERIAEQEAWSASPTVQPKPG